MSRWLCCDVVVAGRHEKLWFQLDRQLESSRLRIAIPSPMLEGEVVVDVALERCVPAPGVPSANAIVGRLLAQDPVRPG